MSTSPPPSGDYPASDARKRKRARGEGNEDDQVVEENGHGRTASSASPGPSSATTDGQQKPYTSAYGRSQIAESSRAAYQSPGPSSATTVPSTSMTISQEQEGTHETSQSSTTNGNGKERDQQYLQRQPQPHASRAARFDKAERILTKDTLEPSYFVVEPNDEFTREVGDWLWGWIKNRADVEVGTFYTISVTYSTTSLMLMPLCYPLHRLKARLVYL